MTGDRIIQIQKKLEALETYLRRVREKGTVTADQLRANADLSAIIERNLQLASEVVLDVANQMIAEFRFRAPDDYKDSIRILGEERVLSKEFTEKFTGIAGFRNILVHDYLKIDYDVIVDKVNNRLGDFETFAKAVADFLT